MMMLPVLQYIQAGGDVAALVAKHQHWRIVVGMFESVGQPVSLAGLLLIGFVSIIGRQVMQYMQRVVTARVRTNLIFRARKELFDKFLAADLRTVENEASGRVLTVFTSEA